jgi:hypothetical protein
MPPFLFILTLAGNVSADCRSYYNEGICDDFKSWSELKNNNPVCTIKKGYINIHPDEPIMLTSDLNLMALVNSFNITKPDSHVRVSVVGIEGIEVSPWPLAGNIAQNVMIQLKQSKIDFYINGRLLSKFKCSKDIVSGTEKTFFNIVPIIYFLGRNEYSNEPVCPFIFTNSVLNILSLNSQIVSVLINNVWKFQTPGTTKESTINSAINQLYLAGYGFNLDLSLMNSLVFESVYSIYVFRSIGSIQTDLFTNFNQTSTVFFQLDNLRNLFHRNGIEWTMSLPMSNYPNLVFSTQSESFGNWIDGSEYTYPDSDLCIFAQYLPQTYLIYVLDSLNLKECTNTIRWLLSNYDDNNTSSIFSSYPNSEQIYSICKNNSSDETIFVDKTIVSQCNASSHKTKTTIYPEYYQVQLISQFVQDLLIYIGIPCACASGLLLNYLVVWTIHRNKHSHLKDDFYKYMSLNSKFNCMYCMIFIFYSVSSCLNTASSYFCSSIRTWYVSQLYKIVLVSYFGESIKMCANISYILITVNRYLLICNKHSPLRDTNSNRTVNRVIGVSVAASFLLNIGHLFQYELNNGRQFTNSQGSADQGYIGYDYYAYDTYPILNSGSDGLNDSSFSALSIYLLIYFLINFVIFFIVNTSIEIILVRQLRKELHDKKTRHEEMQMTSTDTRAAAPLSFRKRRKQEVEGRVEERAIIMVVINALISFFLRLPELFFVFSASKYFSGLKFFLSFSNIVPTFIPDLAYFTYILTFTTNFIIYYLFNQKFKQTFSKWTHVKPK